MANPHRLTIALLLMPALIASGCGSSEKARTGAAANIKPATTSAAAPASTQATTSASTTPKKPPQTGRVPAPNAPAQKTSNARPPKTGVQPSHTSAPAPTPKAKLSEPTAASSPPFPSEITLPFFALWTGAGASKSSGECIVAKYEKRNVERGRAIAELVGIELVVRNHLNMARLAKRSKLAHLAQQYANECHTAIP